MKKCLLLAVVLLLSQSYASAQSDETPFVPGELILMLEPEISPDEIVSAFAQLRQQRTSFKHLDVLSELSNIHLVAFNELAVDPYVLLRNVRSHRGVKAAQFNHYVRERSTVPNDPQYNTQWHHNNIQSAQAWGITTGGLTANGDEIVVAVIETANYIHTDLIDNHWVNTAEIPGNGIDDDGNGYVDDYHGWNPVNGNDNVCCGGHGTAVNGMVGAKGDNGIGGAGVNWDVKIMNVRVGSLTESNVIAAYAYPQTMRNLYNTTNGASGAFVVATNASWGIDNANPANYPVWCAYYDALGAVGILNCGATANNNVNIDVVGDMPTGCGSDYMVAVTATNSNDQRTFSGFGVNSIHLAAPGSSVFLPSGSSGYSNTSGTSFASPCVAGAIALVYSAPCGSLAAQAIGNPQAAADAVRGYIYNGVDQTPQLINETITGGRLNVFNALNNALDNCGPPPVCTPQQVTLSTACTWNEQANAAQAEITVSTSFDSNLCSATQVCYQLAGGSFTCVNLSQIGVKLGNNDTYTIAGLLSGAVYTVVVHAADGSSSPQQITTPACGSLIAGCTDPGASNFNPAAQIDNGSCFFPCTDVQLSITTDCWGGEVSWDIRDVNNLIIASVSGGTYGNQQTYTWSSCLDNGCYTFNIYDSFGDGMNGSSYSSCGVNGDYSIANLLEGTTLVQMGNANYGSGTSHTFCVESLPPDNPDPQPVPCALPYPQVTGLSRIVQGNGVALNWNPILGSLGCEIQGGPANAGGFQTVQVVQPELSSFFIPNNQFPVDDVYQVRVRCGCSLNPPIAGPWSEWVYFLIERGSNRNDAVDLGKTDINANVFEVFPNPGQGNFYVTIQNQGTYQLRVFDLFGKEVQHMQIQADADAFTTVVDLSKLAPAMYLMQVTQGQSFVETQRIVISR